MCLQLQNVADLRFSGIALGSCDAVKMLLLSTLYSYRVGLKAHAPNEILVCFLCK